MAYNQENPFSRKSSPCSREKSLSEIRKQPGSSNAGKYPNVKEFCGPAGGAAKGTYPVNTKERIASAKRLAHNAPNPEGIIACADKAAEGMSRKSSSPLNTDMTIVDEEKGKGESNYEAKHGDKKGVPASRKSSSPASRHGSMKGDQSATHSDYAHYKGTDKGYHGHTGASHGDQSATHRDYMVDDRQSPLSRTGWGAWELKYNAIDDITQGKGEADYGPSRYSAWVGWDAFDEAHTTKMNYGMSGAMRKSSSPANYGSWAHKDAVRAKKLYKEGDWSHAHALGIDEHDADYAKHWHKDEAEHGPSRHAPGHVQPSYNRGYDHGYDPTSFEITLGQKVPKHLRLQNYDFDAEVFEDRADHLGRSLLYPSTDMGGTLAEDTQSFRFGDHSGGLMPGPGSGRGVRKTNKANKTMSQIEALRAAGGNERNIARKIAKLDKTIQQIDPDGRFREAADKHGHGGMYGYTSYRDFLNSPLNNKGHVGDYDGHVHLSAYEGKDPKSLHPYDDGAGGIDYERMARDRAKGTEALTESAQSNIDSLYLKNLKKIQPKKKAKKKKSGK